MVQEENNLPPQNRPAIPQRNLAELENAINIAQVKTLGELPETYDLNVKELSQRTDIELRRRVANWLIALFALNSFGALVIIFLVGLGKGKLIRFDLENSVIMSMLGATVVQAATMLLTITKYLFPTKPSPEVS